MIIIRVLSVIVSLSVEHHDIRFFWSSTAYHWAQRIPAIVMPMQTFQVDLV